MKAVVIHSGGMDSSLCLKLAANEFGPDQVASLSFTYGQRHSNELQAAKKICNDWGIRHYQIKLDFYPEISDNALVNQELRIERSANSAPNTLVVGRNGLMARLGAIFADSLNSKTIYMGVMGLEESNSGYRDCSRDYMDLKQEILRIDLDNPDFEIRTPLVHMTKLETLKLADSLGILEYLLENTITCYEGLAGSGCKTCPACVLKNEAVESFYNQ